MPEDNAVQPEGQGGENGLYDLAEVPEEIRSQLEPHLKKIEGNATKKFQEAADYKKSWAPFEELGVNQMDPEALSGLLSFAQQFEDPQFRAEWLKEQLESDGLAEQLGYSKSEGDLFADDEPDIETKVKEAVDQAVAPLLESMTQQEQDKLVQDAMSQIGEQMDAITKDNPDLTDEDRDAILRFANSYMEGEATIEEAISSGLEDFKRVVSAGERNLFAKKNGQPSSPEGAGSADNRPQAITDWKQAEEAAVERLKAQRTAA